MTYLKYKKFKNNNSLLSGICIILLFVTLLLLLLGVVGFRFNFISAGYALLTLTKYAIYISFATNFISLVSLGYSLNLERKFFPLLVSVFCFCFSSLIIMQSYGHLMNLKSSPYINDLNTNYDEIINFKVSKHSIPDINSYIIQEYGGFNRPYTNLKSLYVKDKSFEEVYLLSYSIIESMDMKISYENLEEGIIEAVDKSFWYGFKDDFIIRIEMLISGNIRLDIRSASRVGRSDFGENYKRIRTFIEVFNNKNI